MLKTLFFIFLFYMLVKVVSRYFLQPQKKGGNFRFFYQTFKNVRDQQKQQEQQQKQQPSQNGKIKKNDLDNIEEAEYEDVTEENAEKP